MFSIIDNEIILPVNFDRKFEHILKSVFQTNFTFLQDLSLSRKFLYDGIYQQNFFLKIIFLKTISLPKQCQQ